jgi:alkylhydroperoxidase family enzyme
MSLPTQLQKAINAVLNSPGATELSLRRVVLELARSGEGHASLDLPHALPPHALPKDMLEALREFVDKIAERPWTINDDDFARLRAAGYSDDQLYEVTLACALGAGLQRFDAGLRALGANP